jgi:hypothetical protein
MASSEGAASLGATSLNANSLMLGTTLGAWGLPSSVATLEAAGAVACGDGSAAVVCPLWSGKKEMQYYVHGALPQGLLPGPTSSRAGTPTLRHATYATPALRLSTAGLPKQGDSQPHIASQLQHMHCTQQRSMAMSRSQAGTHQRLEVGQDVRQQLADLLTQAGLVQGQQAPGVLQGSSPEAAHLRGQLAQWPAAAQLCDGCRHVAQPLQL